MKRKQKAEGDGRRIRCTRKKGEKAFKDNSANRS